MGKCVLIILSLARLSLGFQLITSPPLRFGFHEISSSLRIHRPYRRPHPHLYVKEERLRGVLNSVVDDRLEKALSPRGVDASDDFDEFAEVDEQNIFGQFSDAVTGSIFSILHSGDDCGIKDSSKNLRVLWVRALLNNYGEIKDDIAGKLLPNTSGLVTSNYSKKLFQPIRKFAEWIASRTSFIDGTLDEFLAFNSGSPCNVVLFGSGYDTRALRYRSHSNANFYEVDLPEVVEGKAKLYDNYLSKYPDGVDKKTSEFLGVDLNKYGEGGLVGELKSIGLDPNLPTLFVWEAVLFYVNEKPKREIFKELYNFNKQEGANPNSAVVFTDSLKPFVDVPFTSETDAFFKKLDADLIEHRSRWGGAVHFATTCPRDPKGTSSDLGLALKKEDLVMSYTPTQNFNKHIIDNPSLDNAWYAVAYTWQISGYDSPIEAAWLRDGDYSKELPLKNDKDGILKPFAFKLWNEPMVIYRDATGSPVCVTDVCPHRSAPLSMGTVEDGELKCFYHGWAFGEKGECTDIPTQRAVSNQNPEGDAKVRQRVSDCQRRHAVVEHEGMVWVWKGELLSADPTLLPSKREGDMETQPIETILDYNVDYSYIIENNLDSPHLFYLHDGSVPPIESIGMMNKNLPDLRLRPFKDDCGFGHMGRFGDTGRVKKLLRFDPPNVVRHGGVSGFEEEFHIIPIAPGRARVLLRQHLPKGPILSTITSLPGMLPFLTALVNNWNYHIALEDGAVMQGQSHLIEDLNAPRMQVGGLGDDLMSRYWAWRREAHEKSPDGNPWFNTLNDVSRASIATGTTYGDSQDVIKLARSGPNKIVNVEKSLGIKQAYIQETPEAKYAPMNGQGYLSALYWDDVVKKLFQGLEPAGTMLKTNKLGTFDDPVDATSPRERPKNRKETTPTVQHVGNIGFATAAVGWALLENASALGVEGLAERLGVGGGGRGMEILS
eukprot:CAMPEP_0118650162 /NCGR_PEP_ID=MMETSP0785-20121206/10099_1 /TAXON_ID=91992 /ORGANISM="Bolidomonas pacifica, Strain CCMP 1866" /LENGTH=943 /DNA_ID=CAMNT_0006542517 /DNA_START=61 /DNA_END=2889 /DNA_ORIENTATION=-